ncbi:hypothetical protein [Actinoplanes teichomyceticus]|uniref:Uncharacterized protein n=1 Tax=Actinoplanes teichomyceticus TaxID=1867 RepID=A0A561WKA3_ACTTI|nr:hypothetical protein [Actinoplanes teichomyceticus]TWG24260.1 hypothetical protein FHX34_102813 [Actinoplanes teichomyceticus]GIF12894.1 hypothetical protein Ate01nite_29260 [Actinoplanes teichomyceticus]
MTVTGFSITVPDSWFELELHPDARNAAVNSLVETRLKDVPELYEHRSALAKVLRETARRAYDSGARFCGTLVTVVGDAIMSATVTVTVVDAPDGQGAADAITPHLTARPRRGADSLWREIESVEIPGAGRVPRTRGVDDVTLPDGAGWVRSLIMQTFVPFPGPEPTRVALITGSSPVLALETEFFDVFDAVTATFRFTGA